MCMYIHSHSLASNSRMSCSRNVPRCLARATFASCRLLSFFFFSARSVVTSVVKSVAVAKSVVVKSVAVAKPVVKAPPPSYAAVRRRRSPLAAAAARAQQNK